PALDQRLPLLALRPPHLLGRHPPLAVELVDLLTGGDARSISLQHLIEVEIDLFEFNGVAHLVWVLTDEAYVEQAALSFLLTGIPRTLVPAASPRESAGDLYPTATGGIGRPGVWRGIRTCTWSVRCRAAGPSRTV